MNIVFYIQQLHVYRWYIKWKLKDVCKKIFLKPSFIGESVINLNFLMSELLSQTKKRCIEVNRWLYLSCKDKLFPVWNENDGCYMATVYLDQNNIE